jgi:hypothetical protein
MVNKRIKLECGSCGAADLAPARQTLWKCNYCEVITIFDGIEIETVSELKENLSKRTRKIESILRKAANYENRMTADGGWLHITKNELVFVPHAFNIQNDYKLVFPFNEIRDVRRVNQLFGIKRLLVVETKDSSQYSFVVWCRGVILDCIQQSLD